MRQSYIPAILVVFLTGIIAYATYFYASAPEIKNDSMVQMLLGNLVAGWMLSLNFWIGSTRKDQPADIAKKVNPPIEPK